jgi:hypothetical protein
MKPQRTKAGLGIRPSELNESPIFQEDMILP